MPIHIHRKSSNRLNLDRPPSAISLRFQHSGFDIVSILVALQLSCAYIWNGMSITKSGITNVLWPDGLHPRSILDIGLVAFGALLFWLKSFRSPASDLPRFCIWVSLGILGAIYLTAMEWDWFSNYAQGCVYTLVSTVLWGVITCLLCPDRQSASAILCLPMLIEIVVGMIDDVLGHLSTVSGDLSRLSGSYGSASEFYRPLVLTIPILVALCMSCANKKLRRLLFVCLAVFLLGLLLVWYRVAIIAVMIACCWLIARRGASKRVLQITIAVGLVALSAVSLVRTADGLRRRSTELSMESHVEGWKNGELLFFKHVGRGTGIGLVRIPYTIHRSHQTFVTYLPGPHNQVLLVLDESGLVGALGWSVFIVQLYWYTRQRNSIFLDGAAASLFIIFLAGVSDTIVGIGTVEYVPSNFVFGALLGLFLLDDDISRLVRQ
jgi:hypothetical protein